MDEKPKEPLKVNERVKIFPPIVITNQNTVPKSERELTVLAISEGLKEMQARYGLSDFEFWKHLALTIRVLLKRNETLKRAWDEGKELRYKIV